LNFRKIKCKSSQDYYFITIHKTLIALSAGIYNAILTLATICVLHVYFNIGLTYKQLLEMIPQWMVMGIACSVVLAAVCCYRASRLPLSQQNPKLADTGRIYNFFMGKEIAPSFGILNLKATLVKTFCNTAVSIC
jgi:hypothetical protein